MRLRDVLCELMNDRDYTYKGMAEKLGYKTISGVSERVRQGNMKVDTLIKFAEVLDCEVVLRSTTKSKKEWVLTCECQEEGCSQ